MESISLRSQLWLVSAAYAAVAMISAVLIFMRHLQYMRNPADAAAYGGMWAGGDMVLGFFICCMFLVPTFFLILVIAKSEPASAFYSKIVLCFSLTAPLSVGSFFVPTVAQGWMGYPFLYRLLGSPMVLVGMAISRLMVRFPRAKRLTSYALMIEVGNIVLMVALLFSPWRKPL